MNSGRRFAVAGAPFVLFTIASWLALSHLLKDRFAIKVRSRRRCQSAFYVARQDARILELHDPDLHSQSARDSSHRNDLAIELRDTMAHLDIEHYENKPVPR